MPLSIGKLTWNQSSEFVKIRIQLHSAVSLKVLDIFTHSEYIKINAPPFYREIFLLHPIDAAASKCRVLDHCVHFELHKREPKAWGQLEFLLTDKSSQLMRKGQILEDSQKQTNDRLEEKMQRKEDTKRGDMLKEIERQNELRKCQEEAIQSISETVIPIESSVVTRKHEKSGAVPSQIRKCGSIAVTFSERVFLTPKRESQTQLEEDWRSRQLEIKRSIGFVEDDLREEERNPEWLLAKGNEFYGHGNFLAAISAYSTGVKCSNKGNPLSVKLHLNRAGAHLGEKNYIRCVEDCSKVLQLLHELDSPMGNENIKIQCLARRGAALCKMGLLKEGYGELKAAWEMDKANTSLQEDMVNVANQLEENEA